ncbi:amino acid/amide ABC transporter membrane protein 2 (HAAT family) /amino acid/amide ABC transporter ATP-binding protein 1 (HAAT family) [Mesorhizobium loti]|uniref:Amino acid/amide ABC transporter membrane protein 2 (HAAT family) /amino acid/amide ABC transporter ATP-binding protein 1 (HAAT family) n=1 Tax=Rhizobium loti TaxID=381 RepID=A0A8E2WB07_RHILI|nr:branched-chain amino acid ABC transporter ATP-binding protein/permease [Mesorhizobium loti]PWJ88652.1 amino acid/amide ABC transporter membrane protein 2 (HAAT family) /amino acid/amide ABC transporter ATP-binding protein 1 (HAAT family) [Mesorhizobium loti]
MASVTISESNPSGFMPAAFRNATADALCMVAVLLLVALAAFIFGGAAMQRVVTYAAIMLTAVLGLQIFSGNSGIVSFGQAAFVGLGAYATGILTMPTALQRTALRDLPQFLAGHQLSFFAALAVVLVLAVIIGLLTGTPLLRLSGSSASIATLAMLIIVYTLLVAGREITRGSQPFYGVPREVGLWTAAAVASVALVAARLFRETSFGLATRAAANDERGAAAVGVDQRTARLAAWVAGVVAAMAAGALMAQFLGAFSPRDFYFDLGFTMLAMLIVGGMTSSLGAFAGVIVTIVLIEVVRRFEGGGEVLGLHLPVLFGLTQGVLAIAMILVIWRRPTGLFGERELNLLRRPGRQAVMASAAPPQHVESDRLTADHLSRRYAGVVAVDDVSLSFGTDSITGIIGPNGAGKTTLLNMLAGDVQPSVGTVSVGGAVRQASAFRFARSGVARTFQNIRVFPHMTVLENVVVAARQVEPDLGHAEAAAMGELARMGLERFADQPAARLAYGQRRRLEVARALALKPRFLLLDEPAAGMNAVETAELVSILSTVRAERRIGVVLIEHDMRLVMNLCERIVVIDHGRVIADGTPTDIQKNPAVIAAYLGSRTARAKTATAENQTA